MPILDKKKKSVKKINNLTKSLYTTGKIVSIPCIYSVICYTIIMNTQTNYIAEASTKRFIIQEEEDEKYFVSLEKITDSILDAMIFHTKDDAEKILKILNERKIKNSKNEEVKFKIVPISVKINSFYDENLLDAVINRQSEIQTTTITQNQGEELIKISREILETLKKKL